MGEGGKLLKGKSRFKNLRPKDPVRIPSTQSIANIVKTRQSGTFNYVVTEDGKLIIGRASRNRPNGHIDLAQGRDVRAAGEAKFVNGELRSLNNNSGHYQPSGNSARDTALNAFENHGLRPRDGYVER
ncbi:MAG: hypothetical protein HY080_01200 [Gammaproteobacteria bacterium]|nr:hypothetical protein [Gammaproteobacteria bacterium]